MTVKKTVLCSTLVAAALLAGCHRQPLSRDASGQPVFDGSQVRHRYDTPYFCHPLVDARGDRVSECEVIKEWCVGAMERNTRDGRTILGACHGVASVSCYVAYGSGGIFTSSRAFCWETPKDCEAMRARSIEAVGMENVSACTTLDRSFEPPRKARK